LLSRWPIRRKLLLGVALLLVLVATLSASAYYGLYAYRSLVRGLSFRSSELPLASDLSGQVSNLRVTLSQFHADRDYHDFRMQTGPAVSSNDSFLSWSAQFRRDLDEFRGTLDEYRKTLERNVGQGDNHIGNVEQERKTLAEIDRTLKKIDAVQQFDGPLEEQKQRWYSGLTDPVERLHHLVAQLPSHLHDRFRATADEVKVKYRMAIVLTWITSIGALLLFGVLVRLFYSWIFRPLRILIEGSRRVAQGQFSHRIRLENEDEMSELAGAMNDMTARFQATRDDLDRQVRERTKQVVRSEQLASVGFLAAGVAHEINNPLASIALCSESLESRIADVLSEDDDEQHNVIREYLRMIQEEAFRCKQITEQLLDFSRMGDADRHVTELRELVEGVIDMVRHLGKYRDKHIKLVEGEPVWAWVNSQEMKQVAVNLITNGLDSLERGGTVTVEVRSQGNQAEIIVADDGCGMTEEVMQHLFEPFFTRRRGGQGTGLGLSITYRIVADHDGNIEVLSDGPGRGARFVVTLPLNDRQHTEKEMENRNQAA